MQATSQVLLRCPSAIVGKAKRPSNHRSHSGSSQTRGKCPFLGHRHLPLDGSSHPPMGPLPHQAPWCLQRQMGSASHLHQLSSLCIRSLGLKASSHLQVLSLHRLSQQHPFSRPLRPLQPRGVQPDSGRTWALLLQLFPPGSASLLCSSGPTLPLLQQVPLHPNCLSLAFPREPGPVSRGCVFIVVSPSSWHTLVSTFIVNGGYGDPGGG